MSLYIFSFISMLFHFNYTSEIKNNDKINSSVKSYELLIGENFSNNRLDSTTVLKKIDTTKALKIAAPKKTAILKLNNIILPQIKEIITYRIFYDGSIEKHIPKIIKKGNENKYKYVYYNKLGNKYNLGTFKVYKTQEYRGEKGVFVNLINLEEVPKYFKKDKYQYLFKVDSKRSYVNEQTLASFFGAMLEVNYLDIGCNGFSHSDGSSRPSKSHINGNNGDFKYLRVDKSSLCGTGTSLNIIKNPESLDVVRQNNWNNALYKFGWKKFLGWSYGSKGKKMYLNHIPKNTANHFHHTHVQGYEPNFKEITE